MATLVMITSCGEEPTCSDGEQNGNETGIDCGGPECDACPTCDDGIQNGNETGVDCGGDCDDCETTVEDDKANIQQTFDNLFDCTSDFKDSRAVTVLFRNFLNLSDGEVINEDWIEDLTDDLEEVIDFDHVEDNSRFDLAYHAGTHIYDAANETWLKTNNVTDKMIFQFPSEPSLSTNNAELVIDSYSDQAVTIDFETNFLPSAMHAYMEVDGTNAFEITVSNVTYADNANYQLPVEVSAQLFMDPMMMDIELTRVSTTEYEMDMSFSDGNICDIGVAAQFELTDDDFENFSEESIAKVDVQVNIGELSVRTLGDVAALFKLDDDPTEAQINSFLDLDVFFQDLKIADLEYDEAEENFVLFYKDASSESAANYIDSFLEEIEALIVEFTGEW